MYENVTEMIKGGLQRYVENRINPGSFMLAVLKNNLIEAHLTADGHNRKHIPEIINYCVSVLPPESWGSNEAVEAWLAGPTPVAETPEKMV